MAELVLTTRAKDDLEALPRPIQSAVLDTLTLLQGDPEAFGKQLRGTLRGLWSCRIGNYRILYTIDAKGRRTTVIVRTIRHRATAYGTKSGRPRRRH